MPTAGGVAVALESVGKTFANGSVALRDMNLAVAAGEWLALVGPSGCGKTTTLRVIAGLAEASEGTVRIAGANVNRLPPWRRNLAMVFQRPALAPTHTVRQNLALAQPTADPAGLQVLAEQMDLVWELDLHPHQLSGGQQQRVALGRAMARRTPLYLLDEPLGHLDAPLRDQLRRRLQLWRQREPATVILVTHDPAEAWALADRVAVMWGGKIWQVGPPDEIYRRPKSGFVAGFFSQGSMNSVGVQLRKEGNSLQWKARIWPDPIPFLGGAHVEQKAVLGVRAENVRVGAADGLNMQASLVDQTPHGCWVTGQVHGMNWTGWSEQTVRVGDKVGIMIDWTKAFVFDQDTDETLFAPAG